MVRRFGKLKYGVLASALLIIGFGAGWLSATVLGSRIPLDGDIASLFGPGRAANEGTPRQLRDQFGVFWEVWNLIEGEFYHHEPLNRQRMIQGAIKGLLASLDDQYTVYQEPDLAAQTNEHMQGTLEGIGVYIRIDGGKAYIEKPFKDSPAMHAGLRQGDEIVKVDDEEIAPQIAGLDINQATVKVTAKIRGPEGTIVRLTIRRAAGEQPFEVTLVRAQMIVGSITSRMLDDGIAYIQIGEFKATTTSEFDAALRDLLPQRPQGIVLDLRNNPGGYLSNAREVLGRFYDGVALYEEDGSGRIEELRTIGGASDTRAFDMPLVVLINGNSASASEIVAGALRDARAKVYLLGEKSFGKGSVQNIHALSDGGGARITIAHWLTPNKSVIHRVGITPQFVVPYAEDPANPVPCVGERQPPAGQSACADSQLAAAIRMLATGQAPLVTR